MQSSKLWGKDSGFLKMVISTLVIVLWVTLFSSILSGFETLRVWPTIASYPLFLIIVRIVPTVLFLVVIFGGAAIYTVGYKQAVAQGINGLILAVSGALEIILFVTLFATIMTGFDAIMTFGNLSQYIALSTVIALTPAVLFLLGIFGGGATAVGGARQFAKQRKGGLAA